MALTEIAQDVFRIESIFGGRLLYLYVYKGSTASLLIDSGASVTPEEAILPDLAKLGVEPDLLLVTHCDLDHQGGNHRLKTAFPEMLVACGAGDEALVADPSVLVEQRYSAFEQDHGVGFPTDVKPRLVYLAGGSPVPVDRTFSGGEHLRLSDDWSVEVIHLAGHSRGHLGIYDPRSNSAVTQDAVHGRDYPFADGKPWALMPTYYFVESYLETVEKLASMKLASLHRAHWPQAQGDAVNQVLAETRSYTLKADALVYELVAQGNSTLREIMETALPALGEWDVSKAGDFACSMFGHLQRLSDAGLVSSERREGLLHYKVALDYRPPEA